jgi:hypothetical protein
MGKMGKGDARRMGLERRGVSPVSRAWRGGKMQLKGWDIWGRFGTCGEQCCQKVGKFEQLWELAWG